MIPVTRLNGTRFYINPELIVTIEETPDTIITLDNNEKLVVKESATDLSTAFVAYQRQVHQEVKFIYQKAEPVVV